MRQTAILFSIGAVLGTALDQLHVLGGATSYAAPFLFGQPAWTPLLFGGAAVGFADLDRRLRRLLDGAVRPPTTAGLLRDFLLFAGAYALTAFAPLPGWVLLSILVVTWTARALLVSDQSHRLLHAVACAAIGVGSELVLTGLDVFTHHRADALRLPYWLPGLYLLAAPFIAGLDEWLSARQAATNAAQPD